MGSWLAGESCLFERVVTMRRILDRGRRERRSETRQEIEHDGDCCRTRVGERLRPEKVETRTLMGSSAMMAILD